MPLAPVIFATVVLGIAKMGDIKEVGKIGARALSYFEVVLTIALVLELIVVNIMKPGVGMNIDVSTLNANSISQYQQTAQQHGGFVEFVMNIIPTTMVDACCGTRSPTLKSTSSF